MGGAAVSQARLKEGFWPHFKRGPLYVGKREIPGYR
jgi:hypothetical protein